MKKRPPHRMPSHLLPIHEVRPVSSRLLKSTFDTLRPCCTDRIALDLFAGHGRFGLTALSEGALHAVFVESSRPTMEYLQHEARLLMDRTTFFCMDVFAFLKNEMKHNKQYSLIFADPPFSLWSGQFEMKLFTAVCPIMKPEAIFLVKHPKKMVLSLPSPKCSIWKTTLVGESGLTYFRYNISK